VSAHGTTAQQDLGLQDEYFFFSLSSELKLSRQASGLPAASKRLNMLASCPTRGVL
jgi:hypothetical protein